MIPTTKKIQVTWVDSVIMHGGWFEREEALHVNDEMVITSVGFVLRDDKEALVIASSIHGDNVSGVTKIPRSAIRSRTAVP